MALSIIRKLTDNDKTRVEAAANRFCARHNISVSECETALEAIDYYIANRFPDDRRYYFTLWQRCFCRALRVDYDSRVTTGWGNIGYCVD